MANTCGQSPSNGDWQLKSGARDVFGWVVDERALSEPCMPIGFLAHLFSNACDPQSSTRVPGLFSIAKKSIEKSEGVLRASGYYSEAL